MEAYLHYILFFFASNKMDDLKYYIIMYIERRWTASVTFWAQRALSPFTFALQIWPFAPRGRRDDSKRRFENLNSIWFLLSNFNFQWNSIHITSWNRKCLSDEQQASDEIEVKGKGNDSLALNELWKSFPNHFYFLFLVRSVLFFNNGSTHFQWTFFFFAGFHSYLDLKKTG